MLLLLMLSSQNHQQRIPSGSTWICCRVKVIYLLHFTFNPLFGSGFPVSVSNAIRSFIVSQWVPFVIPSLLISFTPLHSIRRNGIGIGHNNRRTGQVMGDLHSDLGWSLLIDDGSQNEPNNVQINVNQRRKNPQSEDGATPSERRIDWPTM